MVDRKSVGAAWVRRFLATEPGYGFVDEAIPELTIAVRDTQRGHGIGTLLLTHLQHTLAAISLSCDPTNPAWRLYTRMGFRALSGGRTMLWRRAPVAMSTVSERRVVLTGGPGAGKTTLLAELAAMGYATVEESARAIIAERLARAASPRPDPPAFAREILRRDIEKYLGPPQTSKWTFFDRGVVDALGLLQEVSPLPAGELAATLSAYPFHTSVFILPPWEAIYTHDTERDQSFAEAVDIYARLTQWYRSCGYILCEVPRLPVPQRAEHVLRILADSGA
jgi:predicted ATPase